VPRGDVPILIATDNPETARQLRPLGAFAYIRKPFIWDDLRRRVATVLYSTPVLRRAARVIEGA